MQGEETIVFPLLFNLGEVYSFTSPPPFNHRYYYALQMPQHDSRNSHRLQEVFNMRYIPQNNMFGIIEALAKAIERGDTLSGEEIEYLSQCEQLIGVATNQIEFVRTQLQSQEANR